MKFTANGKTFRKIHLAPEVGDGSISLMADGWYIATLTTDGELLLHSDVPPHIGFNVGRKGHIKTVKEESPT